MKLYTLFEMAAKKICPTCGKSMAGNHYWYKGGWKCKAANLPANQQPAADDTAPPERAQPQPAEPDQPQAPATAPSPPPQEPTQATEPEQPAAGQDPVTVEVADTVIHIAADLKPLLDKEIEKINKIAAKVGAPAVVVSTLGTSYKEVTSDDRDELGNKRKYKIKMLEISVYGNTPRLAAADGSMWSFVGVITPSMTGRSMLKLAPGVEDNATLRELYNSDPYYCDYCRTTRRRNETFIVSNGGTYRQVGRNCLKDFVGGANPHTLLQYFSWFNDIEAFLESKADNRTGSGEGGGGRYTEYYTPLEIMSATVACVRHYGGYRPASSDMGSTTSAVRDVLWGRLPPNSTDAERLARRQLLALVGTPETTNTAEGILQWFRNMPEATKASNSFFSNVNILVGEDGVESRMVGYIVGLYPAWQKDQQRNSESTENGVRLIKEWPADWGDGPRPVDDQPATVKFVKQIQGAYGTIQIINIMFADGIGASWKYSGSNRVDQGDELRMTGTLEQDTYHTPARIKFIPDRRWLRSSFPQQLNGE